jgi:hypothetical protein
MRIGILIGTALAFLLSGCGLVRQQEMKARAEALQAQSAAATQECEVKFPKGNPKAAMDRTRCMNNAQLILRPLAPYPDLMDLYLASNMAIAERLQKGQITIAQANEEIARKSAEITSEQQRRMLADRSVSAQEDMAAASARAAGPHSCTRIGNTVNCF